MPLLPFSRRVLALSYLPLLVMTGCAPGQSTSNGSVDINAAALQAQGAVDAYGSTVNAAATIEVQEPDASGNASEESETSLPPLNPPAPGTPGGLPDDRTTVSEAPFTPDSAQGAANVVQTYYALIGEGKYRQAAALRDTGAATPTMPATLSAELARYSEYHANVGAPGAVDAGAGQRYVAVPVQIYARLKQGGAPVYQIGSVTLHRTGDVDGATPEQRSWRIRTIDLKAAPKR